MTPQKTGVLLVNLGTPDSTKTSDVRKYLREFLMDGRVVDVPFWKRWLLVNLIIAPFRAPKSAKEYRKLWTEKGSPLLSYSLALKEMVQEKLGENFVVALAMRYQQPSIASVLKMILQQHPNRLVVLPLFPQYASATNGSVYQKVMELLKNKLEIPSLHFISSFHDHPKMIETFAKRGKYYLNREDYDHILFTYHGLPERQLIKANANCLYNGQSCCNTLHEKNRLCYRFQCFSTSKHLAKALDLSENDYSISFQSRLGKTPWIKPYTDETLVQLAAKGIKKILAFSPSFVADCLETNIEIGQEYHELFREKGGEKVQLVESLNTHPLWVETVCDIVCEQINCCNT